MADWGFVFAANDLPGTYIPNLNLLRTNAQATDAEVVAARGASPSLSAAIAAVVAGAAPVSHAHDAAAITSGVLAAARLGTGTPTAGTWLRGDGAWAALPDAVVSWGNVGGALSAQTDLQAALDAKAPLSHTHPITALSQSGATAGQVLAWDGTASQWSPISPAAAGAVAWGSVVGTLADQADLQAALDTKATISHVHAPADITGFGAAGGYLRSSGTAWVRAQGVAWNDLTSVPTTFTPAAHTHDASTIVSGTLSTARIPSLPAAQITSGVFSTGRLGAGAASSAVWLRGDGQWATLPSTAAPAWGTITGLISSQGDLQSALDGKQAADGDLTALAAVATTGVAIRLGTNSWEARNLLSSDLPSLDAGKITTGEFAQARIPNLDAAKLTTGVLSTLRIPSLDASKVSTGTFDVLRVPDLDAGKIATGVFAAARIPSLPAAQITSGTFATARLGSGTGSTANLLRGDGSWSSTLTGTLTAADYLSTSDRRIKTDVQPLSASVPLRPVRYRRIDTGHVEIGFIAQEVLESYPEAVYEDERGYLSIAYARLLPALAAEVQELRDRIGSQDAVMRGILARLAALEPR